MVAGLLLSLLFYCEFCVYYVVVASCQYPELATVPPAIDSLRSESSLLRVMFVADTHLLGSRQGHWFDKLRREWQMHRSFQTAQAYLRPELVFFLGDLFDEGKWSSSEEFLETSIRFEKLFRVEVDQRRVVVAGNHDIGFHYAITPHLNKRFSEAFNIPVSGVQHLVIKDIHFVLLNSMAMHGDNCSLCSAAIHGVDDISEKLSCMRDDRSCVQQYRTPYTRPILLQHFPLYRKSDQDCNEPDDAGSEKGTPFRPEWDCLSEPSSNYLLRKLNPRLVVSGHTHHGCRLTHSVAGDHLIPEWSVASFSWRNRNNPSFVLAVISAHEFVLNKCYLPQESSVISTYKLGVALIIVFAILTRRKFFSRR